VAGLFAVSVDHPNDLTGLCVTKTPNLYNIPVHQMQV